MAVRWGGGGAADGEKVQREQGVLMLELEPLPASRECAWQEGMGDVLSGLHNSTQVGVAVVTGEREENPENARRNP